MTEHISSVSVDGEQLTGVSTGVAKALAQARAFGYLGPGPLQRHIDHAPGFADALTSAGIGGPDSDFRALDLGSGGGIPGLVLMEWWANSQWTFLDSNQRRMRTLVETLDVLAFAPRASVRVGRAEDIGRDRELRSSFDAVVARGFGGPAVTAECGSGFLRQGGLLVVSEPPGVEERWPERGLSRLGLRRRRFERGEFRFFVANQDRLTPATYPRPVGVPAKQPLF